MFDAMDKDYDPGRYSRQPWWYRNEDARNRSLSYIEEKPSQDQINKFFDEMKILWIEKKATK